MSSPAEILTLPQPARSLHERLWATVARHIDDDDDDLDSPAEPDFPAPLWSFGGGTILAARWDHRRSHDLVVQLDRRLPLHDLAYSLAHDPAVCQDADVLQTAPEMLEIRSGRSSIDLHQTATTIAAGHRTGTVQGLAAGILPSAEILHAKLRERGAVLPTRDLLDLAVASETESEAIEIAVNAFSDPDIGERLQRIRQAPAPDEHPDRTADAMILGAWQRILPDMRRIAADAVARSRYAAAHIVVQRDRMPVCALTRVDRATTLIPFFHAQLALADRGLTRHPLARPFLEHVRKHSSGSSPAAIIPAWGNPDPGPVETALAVHPAPPAPAPPPTGTTVPLHALAQQCSHGERPQLRWLVHPSGDVDLRRRTADDEPWAVVLRARDPHAMRTALVDSGIPIEETTGIPVRGDRDRQIETLVKVHRHGVNRWMRIYQARAR